jgi:hypothetical protein
MKRLVILAALAAMSAFAQHDHASRAPSVPEPTTTTAPQRPAAREWTRLPILTPIMSRGGERGTAALRPTGIEATEVTVFAPGGADDRPRVAYPVGPEGAKIESASPKIGNYHWVTARQESETEVRVASTAWYFGNPGPAPTELLKRTKHELEIVPQPLPREHSSYRETETRDFLVRWNGAPLAGKTLTLESEFGSRSSFVTDERGVATVLLPRDFRDQKSKGGEEGMMGPRRAKFALGVEHDADGKHYLTAFNYTYSPDPERTRSLGWGAAFGVLGMVAALPLLRRRTPAGISSGHTTADSAEKKNA